MNSTEVNHEPIRLLLAFTPRGETNFGRYQLFEFGANSVSTLLAKGWQNRAFTHALAMDEQELELMIAGISEGKLQSFRDQFKSHYGEKGRLMELFVDGVFSLQHPNPGSVEAFWNQKYTDSQAWQTSEWILALLITERGLASKTCQNCEHEGLHGGVTLRAFGSAGELQKILGMEIEPEKEMLILKLEPEHLNDLTALFVKALGLEKKNTGILAILDLPSPELTNAQTSAQNDKFLLLIKSFSGQNEQILKIARRAGALGGTILPARVDFNKKPRSFFDFDVSLEEDLILILADAYTARSISIALVDPQQEIEKLAYRFYIVPVRQIVGSRM